MLSSLVQAFAMATGRGRFLFRRSCTGLQYAEFLRRHGGFHAIGANCYISPGASITDPALVKIGDNVRINECAIFCHNGAVNMINRAFGLRVDSVGKVEIRNNVYIGYGAIILPGVAIGPNAVVAAGSIVTRDVPENSIVAGSPAKSVSTLSDYVEKLKRENDLYPWRQLRQTQENEFDPNLEPELLRQRIAYFYPMDHVDLRPMPLSKGWYVKASFGDGRQEQIPGFSTRAKAEEWIESQRARRWVNSR